MSRESMPGADAFRTQPSKKRAIKATAYNANGQEVSPDAETCVAKAIPVQAGGFRFLVRRQTAGGDRFYNPIEHEAKELRQTNPVTGRPRWEFAVVHEDSFNHYVRFLTTGNFAHLHHAERIQL